MESPAILVFRQRAGAGIWARENGGGLFCISLKKIHSRTEDSVIVDPDAFEPTSLFFDI